VIRTPLPPSWTPAFIVGVAAAVAGELSVGLLLYVTPGFLPVLTLILTVLLGSLALGLWTAPKSSDHRLIESIRRRWMLALLAFAGGAAGSGAWTVQGGLSEAGVSRGVGLALLAAFPLYACGALLGAMARPIRPGAPSHPIGVAAVAGAALGTILTGNVLVGMLVPVSIYAFCLVLLSGGALLHGRILATEGERHRIAATPSAFGEVGVEEWSWGSERPPERILLENGRVVAAEDLDGRPVRRWEAAALALLTEQAAPAPAPGPAEVDLPTGWEPAAEPDAGAGWGPFGGLDLNPPVDPEPEPEAEPEALPAPSDEPEPVEPFGPVPAGLGAAVDPEHTAAHGGAVGLGAAHGFLRRPERDGAVDPSVPAADEPSQPVAESSLETELGTETETESESERARPAGLESPAVPEPQAGVDASAVPRPEGGVEPLAEPPSSVPPGALEGPEATGAPESSAEPAATPAEAEPAEAGAPQAAGPGESAEPGVLLLGGGALTLARHLLERRPEWRVDVIERNEALLEAAREHFAAPAEGARLRIVHTDPLPGLASCPGPYHAIVLDGGALAPHDPVPLALAAGGFEELAERLHPDGFLVVGGLDRASAEGPPLERFLAGAGLVFPSVALYAPTPPTRRASRVESPTTPADELAVVLSPSAVVAFPQTLARLTTHSVQRTPRPHPVVQEAEV